MLGPNSIQIMIFVFHFFSMCTTSAAPRPTPPAQRAPSSVNAQSSGESTKEISEALNITGQSRNLSMGLLLQKKKDKLSFGNARTNYQDKVSLKKIQP